MEDYSCDDYKVVWKEGVWKKSIKIIQKTKFGPRTEAAGMGQNGVIKELLLGQRRHETLRLVRKRLRRKIRGITQNMVLNLNLINEVLEKTQGNVSLKYM